MAACAHGSGPTTLGWYPQLGTSGIAVLLFPWLLTRQTFIWRRMASLRRRLVGVAAAVAVMGLLAACSSDEPPGSSRVRQPGPDQDRTAGFFPNLTHAPAPLIGLQGLPGRREAARAHCDTDGVQRGSRRRERLCSVTPGHHLHRAEPTISPPSRGEAVKYWSPALLGGQPGGHEDINSSRGSQGQTLATPQLGNTRDVALRYWLTQRPDRNRRGVAMSRSSRRPTPTG